MSTRSYYTLTGTSTVYNNLTRILMMMVMYTNTAYHDDDTVTITMVQPYTQHSTVTRNLHITTHPLTGLCM